MGRWLGVILAAVLLGPATALGAAPEGAGGASGTPAPADALAALRQEREAEVARRDAARLKFHTYGLPQYSLEAEAAERRIAELDRRIAELEGRR